MKLKVDYFSQWSLVLIALAFCQLAIAQRTITGTVTDAQTGEALIGANILVVGTSTGTVTDFDGTYTLSVPEDATQLDFSYTGYSAQRVTIGNSTVIDIQLSAGEVLEEVVVVGYGTVKKEDATGAVLVVGEKDFNKGVITSAEQLLQGRAAGVQVGATSGEPGAAVDVRIRGSSSVRSNNNPLFVVDGVPLAGGDISSGSSGTGAGDAPPRNPLNFLNPNDIQSISVLKDASATAIYGSRGANGVVLITTKSGKGRNKGLSYTGEVSLSSITKKYDILDAEGYKTAAAAAGGDLSVLDKGGSTDWQDVIFRDAVSTNHNISYGSGDEQSNYRISFGYQNQQGVVEKSGMERLSGRINANHSFLNDRIKIGAQLTVASVADENPLITRNAGYEGDLLGATLNANPTQPITDANGEFVQPGNDQRNPAAILAYSKDNTKTTRILGNISADFEIARGFFYRLNAGLDRAESTRSRAYSSLLNIGDIRNNGGRAFINDNYLSSRLIEHTLNYAQDFGTNRLDAVVGYSYQDFDNRSHFIQGQRFRTTDLELMLNNLTSANFQNNADAYRTNSSRSLDKLQSLFGRVNFSLANKYLFTATVRADGSSKFGEDNRYGTFPSFAFAWRIGQEAFMPESLRDFKLRLGWGLTGNQEFPGGQAVQRFRYNNDGNLAQESFANPDLKWEQTQQINVGLDYGFGSGRINGSIDFYRKVTSDLLFRVVAAQPAAQPFLWTNLDADVINTGVEFVINWIAIDKPNSTFNIGLNATYNNNIVEGNIGLINTGEINGQGLSGAFAQRIADGQPLYSYYMRTFLGYDDEGFNIWEDNEAVTFIGKDPLPDFTAGLNLSYQVGNFDASIFFNGVFGAWIYNNTANALFTRGALGNGRNVTTDVANSPENVLNSPDVSTRFLEDGSFVRLQNLNLGYNIATGGNVLSNLRVFLVGQNLLTFTSYSGQDPEVNTPKPINDIPSLGIDYTAYPRARTITVGVNLSFR